MKVRARSHYVVTFYSYKGGVGRTTLLANAAFELARRGHRVVLWDLDLEAPGLHEFPQLQPTEAIWHKGLLEWMSDYRTVLDQEQDDSAMAQLMACVYSPTPMLHVLPAHGTNADPALYYQTIPWHELLVSNPTGAIRLIGGIIDRLVTKFAPSFVFIDSRTGLTDLGGLLTAQIPDCTVLVGNYGRQNISGLRRVHSALHRFSGPKYAAIGRDRELDLVVVASPVPAVPNRSDEHRHVWAQTFDMPIASELQIPLHPELLLGEDVVVRSAPTSAVAAAYRAVVDELVRRRANAIQPEGTELRTIDTDSIRKPFLDRCKRLLGFLNFEILPSATHDFSARQTTALSTTTFNVKCVPGEFRLEEFTSISRAPPSVTATQLVIADAVSTAVRASNVGHLAIRTVREIEHSVIDLQSYAKHVRSTFEASDLARTYVRQRFRDGNELWFYEESNFGAELDMLDKEIPDESNDALAEAHRWSEGEGERLWHVLGDYGTGKTSFFRRFAYELALRALSDPDAPVPIAIDLGRVSAVPLELILQQHFGAVLRWHGDPKAVLDLLSAGRVVLLLDAFDEMSAATYGLALTEQMERLIQPTLVEGSTRRGNRVLITCRKHFFRDDAQQPSQIYPGRRRWSWEAPQNSHKRSGQTSELALFNEAQIERFLEARLAPESATGTLALLREIYGLRELAPRPMLLDMIAATVGTMAPGGKITVGILYQQYVRDWLQRASPAAQTTPEHRARLLERLAAELWRTPGNEIHYVKLAEFVNRAEDMLAGLDAQRVDLELRSAAFLIRSSEGKYRFSHRSFLEFFIARHVVQSLGAGPQALRSALTTVALTEPCAGFVVDIMSHQPKSAEALADELRAILLEPYSREVSENALRLAIGIRTSDASITNLPPRKARLEGADLSGTKLDGAVLDDANLDGARLCRASLVGASLQNASLRACDLDAVNLTNANLTSADLTNASLRGAILTGVFFIRARLVETDLRETIADAAPNLGNAILENVDWRGSAWFVPKLESASWTATGSLPHWRAEHGTKTMAVQVRARIPSRCAYLAFTADDYMIFGEGGSIVSLRRPKGTIPAAVVDVQPRRVTGLAVTQGAIYIGCHDGQIVAAGGRFAGLQASGFSSDIVALRWRDRGLIVCSRNGGASRIAGDGPRDFFVKVSLRPRVVQTTQLVSECVKPPKLVVMSDDGRWMLRVEDSCFRVFDLIDGEQLFEQVLDTLPAKAAIRGTPPVVALAIDETLILYNRNGRTRDSFALGAGEITDLAWTTERQLAIVCREQLLLWDSQRREIVSKLQHVESLSIRAVHNGSVYLESRGVVMIADGNRGSEMVTPTAPAALSASFLDETCLIVTVENQLQLWEMETLTLLDEETAPAPILFDALYSPATTSIITSAPGSARVYRVSRASGRPSLSLESPMTPNHGVHHVAISEDGRWTAFVGVGATLANEQSQLPIWSEQQERKRDELVYGVAFSSTERWFATAHGSGAARVWSLPVDESKMSSPIAPWASLEHPESVHTVTFLERWLFSGCDDGTVRCWIPNKDSWCIDKQVALEAGAIFGISISPGRDRIAVACRHAVVILDPDLRRIATLHGHESPVHTARWSPSGQRLVSTSWDGTVRLWSAVGECRALGALYPRTGQRSVWTAGGYITSLAEDMYLTNGSQCAPASLYADRVLRKDLIVEALAGRAIPPLMIDFTASSVLRKDRDVPRG